MPATLKSRIPAIVAELPARMEGVTSEGADLVAERARVRVPDAPPYGEGLVTAIHVERRGPARHEVVAGDNDHWYGHLVEHGTTHSAPHPFLVPSLEESRADVLKLGQAALVGL